MLDKKGSTMGQPVAFFEVISPDAERAQKFYAELFGWQVAADPAMGGYALVDTGAGEGAIGGGIGASDEAGEKRVRIYMRGDRPRRLPRPCRAARRQAARSADGPARGLRPIRHLHRPGRQPGRAVELSDRHE